MARACDDASERHAWVEGQKATECLKVSHGIKRHPRAAENARRGDKDRGQPGCAFVAHQRAEENSEEHAEEQDRQLREDQQERRAEGEVIRADDCRKDCARSHADKRLRDADDRGGDGVAQHELTGPQGRGVQTPQKCGAFVSRDQQAHGQHDKGKRKHHDPRDERARLKGRSHPVRVVVNQLEQREHGNGEPETEDVKNRVANRFQCVPFRKNQGLFHFNAPPSLPSQRMRPQTISCRSVP